RGPRLDHADVTALLAPRLHGVEGADDVGRGELTPVDRRDVLERDALTQLERPRETVRRRGPTRGQIALEFVRAERYVLADLVVDQLAVDQADRGVRGDVGFLERIERRGVGPVGH